MLFCRNVLVALQAGWDFVPNRTHVTWCVCVWLCACVCVCVITQEKGIIGCPWATSLTYLTRLVFVFLSAAFHNWQNFTVSTLIDVTWDTSKKGVGGEGQTPNFGTFPQLSGFISSVQSDKHKINTVIFVPLQRQWRRGEEQLMYYRNK